MGDALPVSLLALCVIAPGCGMPEIPARWTDREIAVDGDYRDWEGSLYHFEEQSVYAGVLRDATYLYLCLSSSDRARVQQVVRGGLTVWFDPEASKTRGFGLRFPLGGEPRTEPSRPVPTPPSGERDRRATRVANERGARLAAGAARWYDFP